MVGTSSRQLHDPESCYKAREVLTHKLIVSPYDARLYLERAICHENLHFPDLAASDAYRCLTLTDELQDDSGEYHVRALDAFGATNLSERIRLEVQELSKSSYEVLVRSLTSCGDLKNALEQCDIGLRNHKDSPSLTALRETIIDVYDQQRSTPPSTPTTTVSSTDLPDNGLARRELYRWNSREPERYSTENIELLNERLAKIAPKCSAKISVLPVLTSDGSAQIGTSQQLGLFANADIGPGEMILEENSMLTANNRLHDPLCDACSGELPALDASSRDTIYACGECDDSVFCSESCFKDAMEFYHPAVCGTDADSIGKDVEPRHMADALYFLLLARTIALSVTQEVHPLDLKETSFLWGEFNDEGAPPSLPFNFTFNILYPIHLMEKMDLDIYSTLESFDTWILNTLYAKFRGVASGRVNHRTGRPETCAVHPFWCLANHSCSPNVRWDWGGQIRFFARKGEELVKWGPLKDQESKWEGGIKKGQEIMNHYCDLELDVKERREWAKGALGGLCRCERCIWEASDAT